MQPFICLFIIVALTRFTPVAFAGNGAVNPDGHTDSATPTDSAAALAKENQKLREQLSNLAGNTRLVFSQLKAERETMQNRLEALQARLNVLAAQPVPLSSDELMLFRNPASRLTTAAAEAKPKLPPKLIAEAQQLFARRQYEQAEAKYLEILQLDGRNVCTLGNLATISVELGKFADTEKYVGLALAIHPRDSFSLGVLGNLRFREGKYQQALEALSQAAQLDPKDATIQNFLGVTLSRLGQLGAAEAALRKALQLEPEYGSAHNNLAVIYVTQKPPQTELARWHYQKALVAGQDRNPDLEKLLEESTPPPGEKPAPPPP